MTFETNVAGEPLVSCSQEGYALTGYARTGKCEDSSTDAGHHHVCLDLTDAVGTTFCAQTGQENWCDAHHPCHGAEGECQVGSWCVCQWAFADFVEKVGCDNVSIDCAATSMRAFEGYAKDPLRYAHALGCLHRKCDVPSSTPSKQ